MMFSYPQYLNLIWKRGNTVKTNPFSRGVDGTQTDIFNRKIYVKNTNFDRQDIVTYNPEEDQWDFHCKGPYELNNFAIATMNGQLILAGGIEAQRYSRSSTTNTQDRVVIWNETSLTWEYPYPPMPTARSSAWLIHYPHYLVVVGGVDREGKCRNPRYIKVTVVQCQATS